MQIRFYANLRTLTGRSNLELSVAELWTLRQLFERLTELYPEIKPHLLDEFGNLRPDVPIFVNGRNPRLTSAGLDIILEPEAEISLFSPIASGRMNVEGMRASALSEQE